MTNKVPFPVRPSPPPQGAPLPHPGASHPFDFSGMPVAEAYKHLNAYQRHLTPDQYMQAKLTIMRPYRARNMLVGGILLGGVAGIFVYSMYKTKPDDFMTVPPPAPPSAA
ncbi:hypothetical protein DFS34DRAFT_636722 [Phlyctochytrium arcticum]|nr:hypothetical protein DFS34DRAFT_636722 [Phlyctochytrium arcticum]